MKLIEELCIFKKCFKIGLLTESVLFLSKSPEGPVTSRRCYQRKMTLCPSFWFSCRLRSPERAEWSFHWLHFDEKYFGSIFIPSNCEFFLSQWLLCFVIIPVNQWSVSSLHFYLRKRRKLTVLDFKHLPSKQLKASIRRFSASVQAKWRHAGGVNEYDIVGIV